MCCLYVCMCVPVRSPGTGVMDSCKPPCWESNPGPMREQQVLSTTKHLFGPQGLLIYMKVLVLFLVVLRMEPLAYQISILPFNSIPKVQKIYLFLGLQVGQ